MSEEADWDVGRLTAIDWLRSLLERGERAEADQSIRAVTATRTQLSAYRESLSPAFRRGIHETLMAQRLSGVVQVDWARGQDGHELRSVRLLNLRQVREFLGAEASTDVADKAREIALEAATRFGPLNPQLAVVIDEMHHQWVRNQSAYRMTPDKREQIEIVLGSVAAILAGVHKGLDMRTFSARIHEDVKVVENQIGTIERILSHLFVADVEGEAFDLKSYIALEKTPHPFLLGGRLKFQQADGATSQSTHYIALPRAKVLTGKLISPTKGFLIIENWTTFEKAASVLPEGWVAMYCAGFPAPGWLEAVVQLANQSPEASLLHWGDLDMGGFRIFEHIAKSLKKPLRPILMTPSAYSGVSKHRAPTPMEASELVQISQRRPALASAIQEIVDTGIFDLEQEAIRLPETLQLA